MLLKAFYQIPLLYFEMPVMNPHVMNCYIIEVASLLLARTTFPPSCLWALMASYGLDPIVQKLVWPEHVSHLMSFLARTCVGFNRKLFFDEGRSGEHLLA